MVDGPFKNITLSNFWKQIIMAALNDTCTENELHSMAMSGIVNDQIKIQDKALIQALLTKSDQLDLYPESSIIAEFNNHPKTPFGDRLQKTLLFNLWKGESMTNALSIARLESIKTIIKATKNSLEEECIYLSDNHKKGEIDSQDRIDKITKIFYLTDIEVQNICDASFKGDKNAFAAQNRSGIDKGPLL